MILNLKNVHYDIPLNDTEVPSSTETLKYKVLDYMFKFLKYRGVISWVSTVASLAGLGVGYLYGLPSLAYYGSRAFSYSGIANIIINIFHDIMIRGLGPRELVSRYNMQYVVADLMLRLISLYYLRRPGQQPNDVQIVNNAANAINMFEYWLNPIRFWLNPDENRHNELADYGFKYKHIKLYRKELKQ